MDIRGAVAAWLKDAVNQPSSRWLPTVRLSVLIINRPTDAATAELLSPVSRVVVSLVHST